MRTVQSYSRMLQEFFGRLGKTPDQVTSQDIFAWAHGVGRSRREPSAVTVGARAACVSSFYRFLIRMGAVTSNPCDAEGEAGRTTGAQRGAGPSSACCDPGDPCGVAGSRHQFSP
jgi:hypothetical protein